MKYILIFTLFLGVSLTASTISAEEKIYTSVLHALFPQKRQVRIWTDDKVKQALLKNIKGSMLVKSKKDADILFLYHTSNIKIDKPKFVGSYALLKHYKKDVIGGFYWQKGRPNLLFLKKNLVKNGLFVHGSLEKYVEDSF